MSESIINKIENFFEENFELLKLESGHSITEDVKTEALNQVLYYWKKMGDVAKKVTETEVKLTLPNLKTPKKRTFTIEGVVDIVREDDEVWMYDIKTHDPDLIKSNTDFYEKQLNVYSYIWQNLRQNQLDHTAIISTAYPSTLKEALRSGNLSLIEKELEKWDPLIEIPHKSQNVVDTIKDFGKIVDDIEDNEFEPATVDTLKQPVEGTRTLFATRVCRNCDARYSCTSFREYAASGKSRTSYRKYFEDYLTDSDKEEWVNSNLDLDKINQD